MWCFAKISWKISVTSHNLSLVSPNYICPPAPPKELGKAFIIYQPFIIPVARLLSKGGRGIPHVEKNLHMTDHHVAMWEKSPHGRSSCGKILHMADCHVEKFLHMRNGVMWRNNVSKINFFEIYAILWRKGKCPTSISSKRLEEICPIAGKKEKEEKFSY